MAIQNQSSCGPVMHELEVYWLEATSWKRGMIELVRY